MTRSDFSKVSSVTHSLHKRVLKDIISFKKSATPSNIALTLYSCASLNLFDKEFFENSLNYFIEGNIIPEIKDLGYIVQAFALLRINYYN